MQIPIYIMASTLGKTISENQEDFVMLIDMCETPEDLKGVLDMYDIRDVLDKGNLGEASRTGAKAYAYLGSTNYRSFEEIKEVARKYAQFF